jgi:hypothetical protein
VKELKDYSGPFVPNIKRENLSKDFLIRLASECSTYLETLDDRWWAIVEQDAGKKKVLDMSVEVWKQLAELRHPKIAKAANIQVKDIVDVMKVWQMLPDGILNGLYDVEMDIKNGDRNHVIWTVTRCRSLEYFEKKVPDRLTRVCGFGGQEHQTIQNYLRVFFPDVETKVLKLPPRKGTNDIACQWEFTRKTK